MSAKRISQKMAEAEDLQNQGKHLEAIALLSEILSESDRAYDKMTAARLIASIHIYSSPHLPKPGTEQYSEIHKFLRIAIANYENAPRKDQNAFVRSGNDLDGLRKMLDAMELGEHLEASNPLQKPKRKRCFIATAIEPTKRAEEPKRKHCFIATAAYGSSEATQVMALRQFRDEVLLSSKLGSLFVEGYYLLSPPLAILVSKSNLLRKIIRYFFLDLLLCLVKKFQ